MSLARPRPRAGRKLKSHHLPPSTVTVYLRQERLRATHVVSHCHSAKMLQKLMSNPASVSQQGRAVGCSLSSELINSPHWHCLETNLSYMTVPHASQMCPEAVSYVTLDLARDQH